MTPKKEEAARIASNLVPFPEVDRTVLPTHRSEGYNAQLFVDKYGADVRYCFARNEWYRWTGCYWQPDGSGSVTQLAESTMRRMLEVVLNMPEIERKVWMSHALVSHTARGVRNLLELARPCVAVLPEDLDQDRILLNVSNGTIDLRSGTLRPHDRADLITRCIEVLYDPAASCPTWLAFLERIFDHDEDQILFVQRALGYSLTGYTREQVLFVCYGTGANGKSTLLDCVKAILGKYCQTADPDSFVQEERQSSEKKYELASLVGTRFAAAAETRDGCRLDEGFLKRATGDQFVRGRNPYGKPFEHQPEFKLWLATNHKPVIRGTDDAIWRRIRLIPFQVTIPKAEQDTGLAEKLLAEAPGILAWLVDGARAWFEAGLGNCGKVEKATTDFRTESDLIQQFVNECCHQNPDAETPGGELFRAFQKWCNDNGVHRHPTGTKFGTRLGELGFDANPTRKAKMRRGLVLDDPWLPNNLFRREGA